MPACRNSVFLVNDDESGLHHDYEVWLEELAPHAPVSQYQHNRTGEDNADAHLKRKVMGREVVVAVTNGRLDGFAELAEIFGTWERILGVSRMADTGVLTAGGVSGFWSRSLVSRDAIGVAPARSASDADRLTDIDAAIQLP